MSMNNDVDCAFTNSPLYYNKAENVLIWLLPNIGKMSPSCPVELLLGQPYHQWYLLPAFQVQTLNRLMEINFFGYK
jgi:hypothetical protein